MSDYDFSPAFYRWRPADEPPTSPVNVLLTVIIDETGHRVCGFGYYHNDTWWTDKGYEHTVAAWKYLPPPAGIHEFDNPARVSVDDEVTS